jgi:hypothetical protein
MCGLGKATAGYPMNKDIDVFLNECRADPWFRANPQVLDNLDSFLAKVYLESNDNWAWQALWDDISDIVAQKNQTLQQRCLLLVERLKRIL